MSPTFKGFDYNRACARIREAQQMMNVATTSEATNMWVRIWRARRRILRNAQKKKSP